MSTCFRWFLYYGAGLFPARSMVIFLTPNNGVIDCLVRWVCFLTMPGATLGFSTPKPVSKRLLISLESLRLMPMDDLEMLRRWTIYYSSSICLSSAVLLVDLSPDVKPKLTMLCECLWVLIFFIYGGITWMSHGFIRIISSRFDFEFLMALRLWFSRLFSTSELYSFTNSELILDE